MMDLVKRIPKYKTVVGGLTIIAMGTKYLISETSKERENKGWDLEAKKNKSLLKIEVKGLSGSAIKIRLTKNEYKKMRENKDSFRLAVVTNCSPVAKTNSLFVFCLQ